MNNNRNQNRRRGRGNRQQGGGGNQMNRIDSRARGNAPQMLDKYKKLAQDAAHNGDRVQAEYYLQFADHYFRVIADNKARQDEQRGGKRGDERDASDNEEGDDDDFDSRGRHNQGGSQGGNRGDNRGDGRRGRNSRDDDDDNRDSRDDDGDEDTHGDDYEPAENPFTRTDRGRSDNRRERGRRSEQEGSGGDEGEIDAAVLPPSISDSEPGSDDPKPKRKPAARRRKTAGGDRETLKAVG